MMCIIENMRYCAEKWAVDDRLYVLVIHYIL